MKKNTEIDDKIITEQKITLPRKKIFLGLFILILSLIAPLFIPFIIQLNISAALKTMISGLLLFGIPEVGIFLAVIILGKEGFSYFKSRLFFWVSQTLIPAQVSRKRYRIGIVLFSVTLLVSFLTPYIGYFFSSPTQSYDYFYIFTLDLLFLISLFILGGNFWDKLKSLFLYDMVATRVSEED